MSLEGTSDDETYETRLGEFRPELPGFTRSGSRKVLQYALGSEGNKSICDILDGSRIGRKDAAALSHSLDEKISRYEEERDSEEVTEYFRNLTGLMGCEIGNCLDKDSDAEKIEQIAEDICLQFDIRENGGMKTLLEYAIGGSSNPSKVYGHSIQEVVSHFEDAIWIGYMEENY